MLELRSLEKFFLLFAPQSIFATYILYGTAGARLPADRLTRAIVVMAPTLEKNRPTGANRKPTGAPLDSPAEATGSEREQLDRFRQWRERWQRSPRAIRDRLAALESLLDELNDASGIPGDPQPSAQRH